MIRVLNALNWFLMVAFAIGLVVSLPAAAPLLARLAHKYHDQPVEPILNGMRSMLVLGIGAGIAAHAIFVRLLAMIATVRGGDPFTPANAARLRVIGWALLAIQLLDLAYGALTGWFALRHVDTLGWQPSIGGWIAVLMVFVLARVFAIGVEMRTEIEMTV